MVDMNAVWQSTVADTVAFGARVAPRGQPTREALHRTVVVPLRAPVLTVPARKLNYRFAAAEALWILTGDNRLEPLVAHNPVVANFSDDGVTLAGAYGPKILEQMDYVLNKLVEDRDTRQATLTIWERNPAPSKDIPCTVAMSFNIRKDKLHLHVYMRSSDIWLGLPYDVFSFSMLGLAVVGQLNEYGAPPVVPGNLYLTAASSHLYQKNLEEAGQCLEPQTPQPLVPKSLWLHGPQALLDRLQEIALSKKADPCRWWTEIGHQHTVATEGDE